MKKTRDYRAIGLLGAQKRWSDRPPFKERFWKRILKRSPEECWIVTRNLSKSGYGKMKVGNKWKLAHRIAYELTNGPIPEGLLVCHKCDNPPCCNPNHLFLGTFKDNTDDSLFKKRAYMGEAHWNCKLSDAKVVQIRVIAESGISYIKIANLFGVSEETIQKICTRKSWRHVGH